MPFTDSQIFLKLYEEISEKYCVQKSTQKMVCPTRTSKPWTFVSDLDPHAMDRERLVGFPGSIGFRNIGDGQHKTSRIWPNRLIASREPGEAPKGILNLTYEVANGLSLVHVDCNVSGADTDAKSSPKFDFCLLVMSRFYQLRSHRVYGFK